MLLGAKGILAKVLYARGLDYETVVTVRAVLAVPGFLVLASLLSNEQSTERGNPGDWLQAIAAGIVCYAFGASVNFYALTLIDASIERALLFSYPAIVVIFTWFASGARPQRVTLIAVIATWVGIGLTVNIQDASTNAQNLVGAAWVLVCSATIAYYFIVSARLTRSLGSARFTAIAMTAAGVTLAIYFQFTHGWSSVDLDTGSWLWMLVLVIFVTVLPLYMVAEGVRRIGAQRGAVASTVGPPAAALLAISVLGETVTTSQFLGIALIVGGIVSLEMRRTAANNSQAG